MRYVNLKKRNTSKFHLLSKRVASVSLLTLSFLAVIVVPLSAKVNELQANNHNQVNNIDEVSLGNDYINVLNSSNLDESKL